MENPERVTYFAATDSRGKRVPFGIKSKDRDRHMYVIGKTGMGKSTLLENMAIQDIQNGEGLVFIDPHGGTVEHILHYVPENRIKDVVYFAPFDLDHPLAFNVMEDVGYDRRHLVVSGLMSTFKKIWEDAWSARMEYILTNTLLALLEYPGATLLSVNRMYTDKAFRNKVVDNVKDPVVKEFWTKEFANYGDRYTQEATPAIQNKVGQFTGNPLIRNIIGQEKSSFDIREMMDNKKILIINLSKGLVGETNMRLLGSMITTRIFLAAMSRANLSAPELAKLPHFYFFVDEFQNFANETFADILSESRKYKLNLIITNQYIEQMEEAVRDAVFGNVGTTVAFRVGPFDAEILETVFLKKFTKEDIASLDKRQVYLTLMIDGVGSQPFSAVTIPPIEAPIISYHDQAIAASREQFASKRDEVESRIMKELSDSAVSEAPQDARMKRKPVSNVVQDKSPKPVVIQTAQQYSQSIKSNLTHSTPSTSSTSTGSGQAGQASLDHVQVKPVKPVYVPPTPSHKPTTYNLQPITFPKKLDIQLEKKPSSPEDMKAILRNMIAKNTGASEISAAATPPRPQFPHNPLHKLPFEVSEEQLRKVLKGEV